jgi:hypothetical protein
VDAEVSSETLVDFNRARGITSQKREILINTRDTSKGRGKHEYMEQRKIIRKNRHKNRSCRKGAGPGLNLVNLIIFRVYPGANDNSHFLYKIVRIFLDPFLIKSLCT